MPLGDETLFCLRARTLALVAGQGGYALQRLHALHDARVAAAGCGAAGAKGVRVHVGVLPAMTGVTRFGEKARTRAHSSRVLLLLQQFATVTESPRRSICLRDSPAELLLLGAARGWVGVRQDRGPGEEGFSHKRLRLPPSRRATHYYDHHRMTQ